jgi:hypothetical protein
MSKKTILLALVAISAAMLALPALASATEIEVDPAAGTKFTATGGAMSITAAGEPTITCETVSGEGEGFSKIKATIFLDLKGCHVSILGFTQSCRSVNAPLKNTIAFGEIADWVTVNNKPGAILTFNALTVNCEALKKIEIGGLGVIGTITAPACAEESKTMKIRFLESAGKQEHLVYEKVSYDLSYKTEGAAEVTAVFQAEITLNWAANIKMTCL